MMSIKLEEEIEKQLDKVIDAGRSLVDNHRDAADKTSQIRNLIEIASAVDSVKALEIFIRYQIGREQLPEDFGKELIVKIGDMENVAKEIAKGNPDKQKIVWLRLNRLLLGYLHRYSVYVKFEMRRERDKNKRKKGEDLE